MRAPALLLLACLAPAAESANGEPKPAAAAECSAQDAKIQQLASEADAVRGQLKQAQAELKHEKTIRARVEEEKAKLQGECSAGQEFSFMGLVSTAGSIAADMSHHLLDQTDIDEQVLKRTTDVTGQVAETLRNVDYYGSVANLTQNEMYLKHVAPHVETVIGVSKPHLETARIYANPAIETVAKTYASAAEAMETQVMPTLKKSSSMVYEQVSAAANEAPVQLGRLGAKTQKLLDPIFGFMAKAAPKHQKVLPVHPVDRLLFLLCVAIFVYGCFRVAKKVLRVVRYVTFFIIWLLLRVTGTTTSWSVWMGTGFYCCGLCGRRKKDPNSPSSKGKKKDPNGVSPSAKQCNLNEVVDMLVKAQQKKKFETGAKTLAENAKSGKPLTQCPDNLKGKTVPRDVLKKALADTKFKKEAIDVKALGL